MSNSSLPLQNTLENVTPLFFHLILVIWKNNGVTFSNIFCIGELEFAIIFYVLWPEIAKKKSRSRRCLFNLAGAINATAARGFLETRRRRRLYLGTRL